MSEASKSQTHKIAGAIPAIFLHPSFAFEYLSVFNLDLGLFAIQSPCPDLQ